MSKDMSMETSSGTSYLIDFDIAKQEDPRYPLGFHHFP